MSTPPPPHRMHTAVGFETEHNLAEAQTDLVTVRDAMEATDAALAWREQAAAYMVDGEM